MSTYEYKVNESLKAPFSKLCHVDIEQMKTEALMYLRNEETRLLMTL